MGSTVGSSLASVHYRALASFGRVRPPCSLFSVRDRIPKFRLPLRPGETEPIVDVGTLLARLYGKAGYDLSIDYAAAAVPPLDVANAAWTQELLDERGNI